VPQPEATRVPRLLLVDDEPHLGMILARVARSAGVEFASRTDAASALEFLQTGRPDVTLLDVNLPGTSGIELLRRLRAAEATAGLKVALFCQSGLASDVAAGWAAGADYLVVKDLVGQPDHLRRRLTAILSHGDGRPEVNPVRFPTNTGGQTTQDWAAPLEQVLSQAAARDLGGEVLEQVVRRAVERAFGSEVPAAERAAWVLSKQGRLDRRALPRAVSCHSLAVCFASLADQLWCLLGTESGQPLAAACQAALNRLFT
jgi:DNA-binding response OmpR family regulator